MLKMREYPTVEITNNDAMSAYSGPVQLDQNTITFLKALKNILFYLGKLV